MILYNFRYRGPYEYDKYVNNILQFYNEVRLGEKLISDNIVNEQVKELDTVIKNLTDEGCILQQLFLISEQIGG